MASSSRARCPESMEIVSSTVSLNIYLTSAMFRHCQTILHNIKIPDDVSLHMSN
jgi:hypothetical protein